MNILNIRRELGPSLVLDRTGDTLLTFLLGILFLTLDVLLVCCIPALVIGSVVWQLSWIVSGIHHLIPLFWSLGERATQLATFALGLRCAAISFGAIGLKKKVHLQEVQDIYLFFTWATSFFAYGYILKPALIWPSQAAGIFLFTGLLAVFEFLPGILDNYYAGLAKPTKKKHAPETTEETSKEDDEDEDIAVSLPTMLLVCLDDLKETEDTFAAGIRTSLLELPSIREASSAERISIIDRLVGRNIPNAQPEPEKPEPAPLPFPEN